MAMNDFDEPKQHTLRDFLYVLFRHKGKILVVFLGTVLVVGLFSVMTPPTYRASGKLLVKLGREDLYTPPASQSPVSQPVGDISREARVNSEIEILKERGLVEKVIATIGVKTLYPKIDAPSPFRRLNFWSPPITPMQRATLQFEKALRVVDVKKSNVIEINFDNGNPEVAARVVNLLIDAFLDRHVAAYKQPGEHDFFDKEMKVLEESLRGSEARLQAFRNAYDISTLQEQKAVLLRQISGLELDLAKTRAEINENRGKMGSMENRGLSGALGSGPYGKETEINTYAISNIKNRIADLKLRERELVSKYSEDNGLVVTIRKEIEDGERLLAAEEKRYHDKEMKTIKDTLAALVQRQGSQARDLARYRAEIRRISGLENKLTDLERRARIDGENFALYAKKTEETRISDAMDKRKIANISVVQAPLAPIKPIRPNVGLNIFLALVIGGGLSLGLAHCLDSLSHRFKTAEDVKKHLELPVLASLPQLKP